MFPGILLFGLGTGLLAMFLAPSSGGAGFIIGFIAGLLLAGGLDLIIQKPRLKSSTQIKTSFVWGGNEGVEQALSSGPKPPRSRHFEASLPIPIISLF